MGLAFLPEISAFAISSSKHAGLPRHHNHHQPEKADDLHEKEREADRCNAVCLIQAYVAVVRTPVDTPLKQSETIRTSA
jgi:hypothetical protein